MPRFCFFNAPERCDMLSAKYFRDDEGCILRYDRLTDEQQGRVCEYCAEELVNEAEYKNIKTGGKNENNKRI